MKVKINGLVLEEIKGYPENFIKGEVENSFIVNEFINRMLINSEIYKGKYGK